MTVSTGPDQVVLDQLRDEWHRHVGVDRFEDAYSRLIEEWREVEWRSGGETLLAALGLRFNEVALCRGLAWLLDPEGGHGLGAHVLDAFLESLGVAAVCGDRVAIRVEERREDARADIIIRAGHRTVIVEAKVHAGEQPEQADRLMRHWAGEQPVLVFLTRTGYLPFTARESSGAWVARTWRDMAHLVRQTTDRVSLTPSAGARELIETIGSL